MTFLTPIRLYLSLAALAVVLGGVWYVRHIIDQNAILAAQVADLTRRIEDERAIADQARAAQKIAWSEAVRQAERAAEAQNIRDFINGVGDATALPDWFHTVLDRLRRTPR